MSWWTDVRDTGTKIATFGAYDRNGRKVEAEQRSMINAQMRAYKEQTELAKKQLEEARAQTDAEKRRVNEKQIRTLRRNYRAQGAGLLGVGQSASEDTNSKLGG
jgi:hypothetical protein